MTIAAILNPTSRRYRSRWQTPEDILFSGEDYLEWCEDNPFLAEKQRLVNGKGVELTQVKKERIPSLTGWAAHEQMSRRAFRSSIENAPQEFIDAYEVIRTRILARQIEGASNGTYNPVFVQWMQEKDRPALPPPDAPQTVEDLQRQEMHMAIHIHPDDPDPLGDNRPLYSLQQLRRGVPFHDPNTPRPDTTEAAPPPPPPPAAP